MVQITIRNVPEEVRDQLAVRAALQRQSMQEYLRGELERIASKPSPAALMERVRQRKEQFRTHISTDDILAARDADRR
jgi:plasmid stability protein